MKPSYAKAIDSQRRHSPELFAREIVENALKAESAGTPLPGFSVSETPDCVLVCLDTPWGRICTCVG